MRMRCGARGGGERLWQGGVRAWFFSQVPSKRLVKDCTIYSTSTPGPEEALSYRIIPVPSWHVAELKEEPGLSREVRGRLKVPSAAHELCVQDSVSAALQRQQQFKQGLYYSQKLNFCCD